MDESRNQQHKSMNSNNPNTNSLQRSKSLSSADALARGIAGLGLGYVNESNDIGIFKPEIQAIVDQALSDPNELNARSLMVLANQIMQRAVEGRRYMRLIKLSLGSQWNKCDIIFIDWRYLHRVFV